MYIPNVMKQKIANTFYDKEVLVLESKSIQDSEGGISYKGLTSKDSFMGNVSFSNNKTIQEDYGLDYEIDISITTDYDKLKHHDLIKFKDIIYDVSDIIISDSHILIVGVKWQQEVSKD